MASSAPAPASSLSCGGAHDAQAQQLPHVVIFPFMAKSHTIPLTDLVHLLRRRQLATVTFLTTPGNAAFVRDALAGTDDGVAIVELPFADNLTDLSAPPRPECVEALDDLLSSFPAFVESVSLLRPRFEEALAALQPRVSAIIADAFLYWAHESAAARGIQTLAFFGANMFAHVVREVVLRDNPASVLTRDTSDAVFTVPEFPHVQLTLDDIPFPFNDPETTGPMREMDAKIGHAIANSQGLIVNTFDAMEGRYVQHWNRHVGPRAWPVGPLYLARTMSEAPSHGDVVRPAWMRWLDEKAAAGRAVLYVALGTMVAIPGSDLREVADGLDRAGLDFIWAVRPVDVDLGAAFEERVHGRGMVVREWVNQRTILAHECVKGFLSHGGWNSALESISTGVPLAVWPMGAEQPLNAKLVVDELGVGIRVPPKSDTVAQSEQIARVTSDLMTGETGAVAARKMATLAAKAREAVVEDGSSWRAMDELISVFSKQSTQLLKSPSVLGTLTLDMYPEALNV